MEYNWNESDLILIASLFLLEHLHPQRMSLHTRCHESQAFFHTIIRMSGTDKSFYFCGETDVQYTFVENIEAASFILRSFHIRANFSCTFL